MRGLCCLVFLTFLSVAWTAEVRRISDGSGVIESPGYPGDYGTSRDITWVFNVRSGYKVVLIIEKFDIEDSFEEDEGNCVHDFLEVIESGKTKCKYCGSTGLHSHAAGPNERIESKGNELTMRFVADYSNEDPKPQGFRIRYSTEDRDECQELEYEVMYAYEDWDKLIYCNHNCHNTPGSYHCSCETEFELHANKHTCVSKCQGIVLTDDSGVIMTSKYPDAYSKLADCDWTIKGKPGATIDVRFIGDFSIEEHYQEGCVYDWMQYKFGTDPISARKCGKQKPANGGWIETRSTEVKVYFHSDFSEEETGFKMEYRYNRVVCNSVPSPPSQGSIHPQKSSYVFEDVVTFNCKQGFRLVGSKDTTCLSDGTWSSAATQCQAIVCPRPDHLINIKLAKPVVLPPSLSYGAKITIACEGDYIEMTSGHNEWICGDNAKWVPASELIAPNSNDNIPECKPACGLKGNTRRLGLFEARRRRDLTSKTLVPREQRPIVVAVVHGTPAKYGEWPWMALIDLYGQGLRAREFCGGSLISGRTVITAAHCTYRTLRVSIQVFLGASERNHKDRYVQTFKVAEMHQHPQFSIETFDNDIAVLVLDSSATIGKYVRPVCLPRSPDEQSLPDTALTDPDQQKKGIIAGWGVTETGRLANELNFARIPPIERTQCSKLFDSRKPSIFSTIKITKNMICAGDPNKINKGRDSCQGDSGGPLMFKAKTRPRYFMNGIVSFGSTENCGQGTFGIYTNVANYIQWIDNFIKD